jgi:hypothetical protein
LSDTAGAVRKSRPVQAQPDAEQFEARDEQQCRDDIVAKPAHRPEQASSRNRQTAQQRDGDENEPYRVFKRPDCVGIAASREAIAEPGGASPCCGKRFKGLAWRVGVPRRVDMNLTMGYDPPHDVGRADPASEEARVARVTDR